MVYSKFRFLYWTLEFHLFFQTSFWFFRLFLLLWNDLVYFNKSWTFCVELKIWIINMFDYWWIYYIVNPKIKQNILNNYILLFMKTIGIIIQKTPNIKNINSKDLLVILKTQTKPDIKDSHVVSFLRITPCDNWDNHLKIS